MIASLEGNSNMPDINNTCVATAHEADTSDACRLRFGHYLLQ